MFFRTRPEPRESTIIKSPSLEHIAFVLKSVVNALNDYIHSSSYYFFTNESKVTDPSSSRGKDVREIAAIIYSCMMEEAAIDEMLNQFFARLKLKDQHEATLPALNINDPGKAEDIACGFILAIDKLKGHQWETGRLGGSSLRDAVNLAIATYKEDDYINFLGKQMKINHEKKMADQHWLYMGKKYSEYFRFCDFNPKPKAAEGDAGKNNTPKPDRMPIEYIERPTYILMYCADGDDKKQPYFKLKGVLDRVLQYKQLDKDNAVIAYSRKEYGIIIGDNCDDLISQVPLPEAKFYILTFNLNQDSFWDFIHKQQYASAKEQLVSFEVIQTIERITENSITYCVNYDENEFQLKCTGEFKADLGSVAQTPRI